MIQYYRFVNLSQIFLAKGIMIMAGKVLPISKRRGYKKGYVSVFCTNVQRKRLELGMTQEVLAEKVGATTPWISAMEAGRFPRDERRVVAIAQALNCSLDRLFGVD